MNRLTEIEVAGKKYPLNFSTKAARKVSERYGGIENIGDAFQGESVEKALDELVWMLALLMEQGAAYLKIVDGEDCQVLTAEQLEVVLGMADIAEIKDTLMQAMTAGMKREVEVDQPKNAKTTQDN